MILPLCDSGYTEIDGECYFQQDVDVLDAFISNSEGSINLILDTNSNGVIEPLELCSQTWSEGRIKAIDCGPIIINGNYNWINVSGEIPPIITNWTQIESLNMDYNDLSGLVPECICDMSLDFSNENEFSFRSNQLCPPFPECVEDYLGDQNNFGGVCEYDNCYDVGVSLFTAYEVGGDNLVNSYDDIDEEGYLLVSIKNNGPDCNQYPGLMITSDTPGVYFPGATPYEEEGVFTTWWYAIFAESTYSASIPFEVSPYVPEGADISLTAKAMTLHCLDEWCIEDPYCPDCPLTDTVSLELTTGDSYPTQLGDVNLDSLLNVQDIVLLVNYIVNPDSVAVDFESFWALADVNQDYYIDILDVVAVINTILDL